MNYLSLIKALSMIVMFSITLIVGNIPLRLKSFKENQRILSLASAFSGGLFLSVGLIHLIPEATEAFDSYFEKEDEDHNAETTQQEVNESNLEGGDHENEEHEHEHEHHFPFAMLITVLSFSFVLMIEKVLTSHEHSAHHHHGGDHDHNHTNHTEEKKNKIDEENKHLHHHHHHHHHHNNLNTANTLQNEEIHKNEQNKKQSDSRKQNQKMGIQTGAAIPATEFMKKNSDEKNKIEDCDSPEKDCNSPEKNCGVQQGECQQIECYNEQGECQDGINNEQKIKDTNTIETSSQKYKKCMKDNIQTTIKNDKEDEESQIKQTQVFDEISKKLNESKNNNQLDMTPYLIQFAFGIHATLEGLAIGVQQQLGPCLTIALAVLAHKWAEGLVLGLSFKKAGVDVKKANYMIGLQAIMNPIGIGLGWLLSDAGDLASGILMSISAGTFLYIATNEVIVEEFSLKRFKKSKFLLYLIGIGFISALWKLEEISEH